MADEAVALAVRKVQSLGETLRNNVERVIIGKRDIIDLLIVALLSDGHVLIEDVPGIGKTMMAKSLARSLEIINTIVRNTPVPVENIASPGRRYGGEYRPLSDQLR